MGSAEGSADGIFKNEIKLCISYHYLKKSQAVFYSRWLVFWEKCLNPFPARKLNLLHLENRQPIAALGNIQ